MPAPEGRTAVYWLYDARGELLYIGVSDNPRRRVAEHRQRQLWGFQVHSHREEWFSSRRIALLVEEALIREELPRWNRDHMPLEAIRRDVPEPPPNGGTQAARYERIQHLREQLDAVLNQRAEVLACLHREIRDSFPENRGESEKRGVLAEVTRRSGYSREHVAQIRDGRIAGGKSSG
ncbi:hypothetical protein PV392_27585 [Streptomyces sp. ME03-5709C]|nr:hypothetical protein [Streptomyces sp. ME03-5709C]